jgi:predicted transglutaminase-like cysteine proteinase
MRRALFGQFISFGQSGASAIIGKLLRVAVIGMPLFVVGAATHAQTLASLPSGSKAVERSGTAKPVIAWVKFCEQFPAECAIDTAEPAVIPLTKETWNALVSVNRTVNKRIKPITDKEHWGLVDRWEFPDDGMGDCEDFQLLKRKMLVERGLPRRAMRMTVVIDELGEGHAVLMVRTDRGDFILDNKIQSVLPWEQTGYVFVKREGHDNTTWVSLGGLASPTTTANR